MKKSIIIWTAMVLASAGMQDASAQKTVSASSRQCLDELKKIVDTENELSKLLLKSGKIWHMNFDFSAAAKIYTDKTYTDVKTKGEIVATKTYKYIKEDQYEIYMDDKDVFTINNDDRSIMRTRSSANALAIPQRNPYFDLSNDSLMRQYSIYTCSDVYDSSLKKSLTCYTISPANREKAMYHLIKIYVDKNAKVVKKIQAWHNTSLVRDMKMCTVIINSSGEKQDSKVKLPVKDMFIAANGTLKTPYHKYKYKDLKK